jgi:S1-C subfamily serine protease
MRMAVTTLMVTLAAFIPYVCPAQAADISSGSGVVIGTQGEILTNSHVVEDCQEIIAHLPSKSTEPAVVIARDKKNDLAVVRSNIRSSVAEFREGVPLRAGDAVVALGYPLSGLLATTANLSVGNVSALAGLRDDSRYVQISAPVQIGNSGGPLLDASGHLVGIVTEKLDAVRVARFTGDIPQNVNFAIKAEVARTFLDSKGIAYQTGRSEQQLSPADVGDIARLFTVHIECRQAASRVAVAPKTSTPSPPAPSATTNSNKGDYDRANGVLPTSVNERTVPLKKGDSVSAILRDMGATENELKAITAAFGGSGKDSAPRDGYKLRVLLAPASDGKRLQPVRVIIATDTSIEAMVAWSDRGKYVAVDVRAAKPELAPAPARRHP